MKDLAKIVCVCMLGFYPTMAGALAIFNSKESTTTVAGQQGAGPADKSKTGPGAAPIGAGTSPVPPSQGASTEKTKAANGTSPAPATAATTGVGQASGIVPIQGQGVPSVRPEASPPVTTAVPPSGGVVGPGSVGGAAPAQREETGQTEQRAGTVEPPKAGTEKAAIGLLPGESAPKGEDQAATVAEEKKKVPNQEDQPSSEEELKAGPLYERFAAQVTAQETGVLDQHELDWGAADCGCVPELDSFRTYGLYPLWAKPEEGQINFESWSRVGYFALSPDEAGNIQPPSGWTDKQGKHKRAYAVPHRYGTKVDIVISNNKWAGYDSKGLTLTKSYVLLNLVDNIVDLVSAYGFDGVTIDFDFAALPGDNEFKKSYIFFIKKLFKTLKAQNERYALNVTLGYYKGLQRQFTKEELGELEKSVDLLLFVPNTDEGKKMHVMKRYDDYFKDYKYGELTAIERKLVFVLDTNAAALDKELPDIRSERFGGVGVWMPNQPIEKLLAKKVADVALLQDQDYVERVALMALPGPFCNVVCPNRAILVGLGTVLIVVYAGAFVLSFFSPVVASVVNEHFLYVLGGVLVIVLLFLSLVSCVPLWSNGWQTELTGLLLVLLGGYAIKSVTDKKREANYP